MQINCNMASIPWGTTRNCKIVIEDKSSIVQIGDGAKITDVNISIRGKYNSLTIGREVVFTGGVVTIQGENTHVRVGDGTRLTRATLVAGGGEPILIGQNCVFGEEALIQNVGAGPLAPAKPIFVPDGTKVGARAQLFKGTMIGEGATIPENAVVAGAIPGTRLSNWAPERVVRESQSTPPQKLG